MASFLTQKPYFEPVQLSFSFVPSHVEPVHGDLPLIPSAQRDQRPESGPIRAPEIEKKSFRQKLFAPLKAVTDPVTNKLKSVRQFFIKRRWLGYSLPLMIMAVNLVRGAVDYASLERDRLANAKPVDDLVLGALLSGAHMMGTETADSRNTFTWVEDIKLIEMYPHDDDLVNLLIPKIFENAMMPETALLLAHTILEIFSTSPYLSHEQHVYREKLVREQFYAVLSRYEESLIREMLDRGYADIPVGDYPCDANGDGVMDALCHGEPRAPQLTLFFERMRLRMEMEKQAAMAVSAAHAGYWQSLPANVAPEVRPALAGRQAKWESSITTDWDSKKSDIRRYQAGLYVADMTESYELLATSYRDATKSYWDLYYDNVGIGDKSGTGLVMMAGGFTFFVAPAWYAVLPVALYYGSGGDTIMAPGKAHELYTTRDALPIQVPAHGVSTENLQTKARAGQRP